MAEEPVSDPELERHVRDNFTAGMFAELFRRNPEREADHPKLDLTNLPKGYKVGEFKLIEKIGKGASAVVYRALQPTGGYTSRNVAVKIYLNPRSGTIEQEAANHASLKSEHVLEYYFSGEAAGLKYVVTEYASLGSLRKLLKTNSGRPLEWQKAADLLEQFADGLDHLEYRGMVHRDIKPENLLLDRIETPNASAHPSGYRCLIGDLGLALRTDDLNRMPHTPLGTSIYYSPEMTQESGTVAPKSDVFSLGVVAYEMLTGEHPFLNVGNDYREVIERICNQQPSRVRAHNPNVPPALDDIVFKMLAKTEIERFSAKQVVEALRALPKDRSQAQDVANAKSGSTGRDGNDSPSSGTGSAVSPETGNPPPSPFQKGDGPEHKAVHHARFRSFSVNRTFVFVTIALAALAIATMAGVGWHLGRRPRPGQQSPVPVRIAGAPSNEPEARTRNVDMIDWTFRLKALFVDLLRPGLSDVVESLTSDGTRAFAFLAKLDVPPSSRVVAGGNPFVVHGPAIKPAPLPVAPPMPAVPLVRQPVGFPQNPSPGAGHTVKLVVKKQYLDFPFRWIPAPPTGDFTGFWMLETEVTQKMFQPVSEIKDPSFSTGKGEDYPVNSIRHYDAVIFCEEFTRKANVTARLPKTAEWVHAALADKPEEFYMGKDGAALGKFAHFGQPVGTGVARVRGNREANPWGLYDMLGNVAEWTADERDEHPNEKYHWVKGGNWSDTYSMCNPKSPGYKFSSRADRQGGVGFRFIITAVPVTSK